MPIGPYQGRHQKRRTAGSTRGSGAMRHILAFIRAMDSSSPVTGDYSAIISQQARTVPTPRKRRPLKKSSCKSELQTASPPVEPRGFPLSKIIAWFCFLSRFGRILQHQDSGIIPESRVPEHRGYVRGRDSLLGRNYTITPCSI